MVPVHALVSLSLRSVAVLCAPSAFPNQPDLGFRAIKGISLPSYPVVETLPACLYLALNLHFMITGHQIGLVPPRIIPFISDSWSTILCPSLNEHNTHNSKYCLFRS